MKWDVVGWPDEIAIYQSNDQKMWSVCINKKPDDECKFMSAGGLDLTNCTPAARTATIPAPTEAQATHSIHIKAYISPSRSLCASARKR